MAEHLGTGAASLYAHVSGKEELLELVYDALVGQVALVEPDPATWRDQLRQIMRDFHDVLVSHTDAALAGLGRIPTSPQTMAAAEVLAGIVRAGGLCPKVVALGLDQLVLYVSATAFEDGLFRRGMDEEEMLRYYAGVHAFYAALPAERYPVLAEHRPGHDRPRRRRALQLRPGRPHLRPGSRQHEGQGLRSGPGSGSTLIQAQPQVRA